MKRFALLVCLIAIPALAQTQAPAAGRGEKKAKAAAAATANPEGAQAKQNRGDQLLEKLTKELTLTTDQQTAIRKLMDDHQQQMRIQRQQTKQKAAELKKDIEAARTAGDTEKVKALETQAQELIKKDMAAAVEDRTKLVAEIEPLLTPEQQAKFATMKTSLIGAKGGALEERPEMLMKAVASLTLPADKMQAIKKLAEECKAKMKAPGADKKVVAADFYKNVMAQLTPEEQEKVKQWKPDPAAEKGEKEKGGKAAKGEKTEKGEKKTKKAGKAKQGDGAAAGTDSTK